ncbi:ERMES complex subunit MDM12 [Rhodotorula paludigena]|uniref:ERMES complex subunit MDM12 n=1 Tax=Rhodotorula paludigena TaxID=86838 RepID=UPI00317EF6DB
MSIDLDWSALDAQLTLACTRFLATAFDSAPRPDFLGPLTVTAFSFGDTHPDLLLADIRDIDHHFLVPDPDLDDGDPAPAPTPTLPIHTVPASPASSLAAAPLAAGTGAGLFSPGLLHHHHHRQPPVAFPGAAFHAGHPPAPYPHSGARTRSRSRSHSPHPGGLAAAAHGVDTHSRSHSQHTHPHSYAPRSPTPSLSSLPPPGAHPAPTQSSAPSPSFQLHVRISYAGNLTLGLSTALLINYPSPAFMRLPLALTLTGLALEGTLVVAFEGGSRRVHLSLLCDDDEPTSSGADAAVTRAPGASRPTAVGKRESPGARLLRAAHVESEVGQADKHVLRNVGKVEKFVLDVARRTLENELVFPNFQTIMF